MCKDYNNQEQQRIFYFLEIPAYLPERTDLFVLQRSKVKDYFSILWNMGYPRDRNRRYMVTEGHVRTCHAYTMPQYTVAELRKETLLC